MFSTYHCCLALFSRLRAAFSQTKLLTASLCTGFMLVCSFAPCAVLSQPSVTLTIASNGIAATTLPAGSVVTFTATVAGLTTPPAIQRNLLRQRVRPLSALPAGTAGQVNFCDASASDCLGGHLLGTAQLTSGGSASFSYVPGIGGHSYKAVFLFDAYGATSESSVQTLTVTGSFLTATTIAASGTARPYTLVATVAGESNLPAPVGGSVSFLDASNSDALLGAAALIDTPSAVSFNPTLAQATGESPVGLITADFNGDGYVDSVTSNTADNSLTVLLGRGDGTFTAAPVIYPGLSPHGTATGDWNGDGKPDLAVTTATNGLTILLGNGDGTFTTGSNPTAGNDPYEMVTADFNADGNADLAVANYIDSTITILLGNGDGTFTAAAHAPATGANPVGIIVADFNGDTHPDLITVNYTDSSLTVLLGNGDGTFNFGSTIPVGTSPGLVATGDFNGDGKLDLAVTNSSANTLSILLGNGDGTFTAAASPVTGTTPLGITVADLNRDGKADLVVANYGSNNLSYLLGNGDGTFTPAPAPLPSGIKPLDVVAVDLNGDGVPDLLTTNYTDSTMTVLLTQITQAATATLTAVTPLGTGTHNVLASYPLTAPYGASQSATTPLTAAIAASTLTLTASPASSSSFGELVVLTAKLTPYAPEGVSTNAEIVTFYDGTSAIGTGTLTNGVATLTLSTLPIGTDSLTAKYPGDADLATSTSTALAFTVADNSLTMTLSGGTTTTNIAADGTATYAFMVTPGSATTFGENVTFAVTGGPKAATNTFNPTSIAAGSGATTVTLTVAMPATAAVKHDNTAALARHLAPIALALVLLPFAGSLRRSGKRMLGGLCLLLILLTGAAAVSGLAGCGSGSTPVTPAPAPTPTPTPIPTPTATNYTLTVTATTGATAKSTTLTLTVE